MLRVAIIGCGKIADQHVEAIRRVADCEIVATCDRERLMAAQLAGRYAIPQQFGDAAEMLREAVPDVVHITTPPQSHHALGSACLAAGAHVYIEKPFAITEQETRSLIAQAERHGRRITAGHNYQFTRDMIRMRQLVASGFLGGPPTHLESYWSYDLSDATYVGPVLGNRQHWVRQLPGQLLHNVVSHGLAKLAEFLSDDLSTVSVTAGQSPVLRTVGDPFLVDELRMLIEDARGVTASFCFSTQIKPQQNRLHLYGPKNSIIADQTTGSLIRETGAGAKSYLTYFVPPMRMARQHVKNARQNVVDFCRQRLYQDFGMKELVERFYESIRGRAPVPIPYREIVLTAELMDRAFDHIRSRSSVDRGEPAALCSRSGPA